MAAIAVVAASCKTEPAATTSDKDATAETVALYKNMKNLSARGTMIGHQDALAYGVGWYGDDGRCDFKDACGDYPAVFGWEIGEIEQGAEYSLDSIYFDRLKGYIRRVYDMGGINSVSWHARNPLTKGDAWDVSSKEVVTSILPGGENHGLFLGWLDIAADFFLDLKGSSGEPIPVIFRPYHELTGSWFWWGKELCTPEQYVTLWRITADHMRNKGVHNLLWAYSTAGYETPEEFLERYPGDDYVDLVGFDAYQHASGEEFTSQLKQLTDILMPIASAHGKVAALTEAGYEGVKGDAWYSDVLYPAVEGKGLSYVLLWRNAYDIPGHFYTSYPGHTSTDDLRRFVAQDDILTAGKLKDIYR